jgi:hypothetical protein
MAVARWHVERQAGSAGSFLRICHDAFINAQVVSIFPLRASVILAGYFVCKPIAEWPTGSGNRMNWASISEPSAMAAPQMKGSR